MQLRCIIVQVVCINMTLEILKPFEENFRSYRPDVVVLPSTRRVDGYAFSKVKEKILENPYSVLTLATGSSPLGLYNLMIQAFQRGELDMSGLTTRNLDEYSPLPKNHPQSYDRFMRENLFNHINIPECQRHIPNSAAENPEEEVSRYQSVLKQTGPADLTILGIGPGLTCHIAFNERGSTPDSRTRLVEIDPETVKANARFFDGDESLVPHQAITQGIADILESKEIILIAKGEGKAQGIQRSLEGPINSDSPASFLRLHPNVTFILDEEAAGLLRKTI